MKERASAIVGRFELYPDIERIDGAAGKEMSNLARPNDNFDTRRLAASNPGLNFPQRPEHLGCRPNDLRAAAKVARFFADRKRARQLRLAAGIDDARCCRYIAAYDAEDVH